MLPQDVLGSPDFLFPGTVYLFPNLSNPLVYSYALTASSAQFLLLWTGIGVSTYLILNL